MVAQQSNPNSGSSMVSHRHATHGLPTVASGIGRSRA